MTTAVVKAGRSSWVGAAKPGAVHDQPPRLRAADTSTSLAFLRARNPVPSGDTVSSASLQVIVASGAAGSVTFTLKRVTQRVTWDDLSWNTKPSVTATGSTSVTVSAPGDGTVLTFDVTGLMQTIAGGSDNFGWRLEATSAVKVYGYDSVNPPVLTVVSSSAPATPTDLRPAGTGSKSKPWISFTASDVTGEADMQSIQVQLSTSATPTADSSGTWTSPTFDTGEVAATTPDLDLSTTAYGGLADLATIYWHVRWKSGGVWSPWSDTVAYARKAWGTLTVTNPSAGVVEEPTPPIIATYSAIRRFRVQIVLASDNTKVIASSDWTAGGDLGTLSWTVTKPLQDAKNYVALVDVKGTTNRAPSIGDPDYLRATVPFTTTFVGTVTTPTLSSVVQDSALPVPRLTFTRATAPDSFTVLRDGEVIAADLDPASLLVSGTTYSYLDLAMTEPYTSHTYQVAAVVNGQRSAWSSSATVTVKPAGLWLIADASTFAVMLDTDAGNWTVADQTTLFRVIGQRVPVQVTAALGVLEGTVTGNLLASGATTATVPQMVADLEAIRDAGDPVTMVAADFSGRVRLRNVRVVSHADRTANQDIRAVSFDFFEVP